MKRLTRIGLIFCVLGGGLLMAQKAPNITVPADTVISADLQTFLSTKTTNPGDNFHAEVVVPVVVDNTVAIPKGAIVIGRVVDSKRAGRVRGKAEMVLAFDKIMFSDGYTVDLNVELKGAHGQDFEKLKRGDEKIRGDSSKGKDVATIAGVGATGAGIGAIAGRGKGVAIGGGAGAAGGLAAVLLGRGPELVLNKGTQLDLVVKKPIVINK